MTEDETAPEVQIDQEPVEATEPQPPQEPAFSQAQVNSIVAREVAKAERRVKKAQPTPTKTEPTIGTGDSPAIAALTEQIQTLAAFVESKATDEDFAAKVAGVQMDSDERAMLKLSFSNDPELFSRRVEALRAKDQPPAPKGPGFDGIGAPNPIAAQDRETDPMNWDADTVARYRADGTFLKRISDHKATLPGGSGGLFKPKPRKG